jgi:hypothetical protein
VILLGVLSFFLGFAPYERESATGELPDKSSVTFFDNVGLGAGVVGLSLLVAAALVAAFGMLPRHSANEPIVAGLSVAGLLSLLCLLIGLADAVEAGVGLILVLVASFLQAALAIGNLLISSGIVRLGSSEPDVRPPQSGYGWQQPYPRQSHPSDYGRAQARVVFTEVRLVQLTACNHRPPGTADGAFPDALARANRVDVD